MPGTRCTWFPAMFPATQSTDTPSSLALRTSGFELCAKREVILHCFGSGR